MSSGEVLRSRLAADSAKRRKLPKRRGFGSGLVLANFFKTVANGRAILTYRPKQVVFAQDDTADTVVYIKSGKVKVTVVSGDGHEAVVAIQGSGEFLGEGCLIGYDKRRTTATAMTECEIAKIDKAEVVLVIQQEPAFALMFMAHILTRNARMEEDLVDHLLNSTERRLARALLLLANFGNERRPKIVMEKISQETLAEMIGATRSRVSHFMNKFRQLGYIDYNGHLEIRSSLLTVVVGDGFYRGEEPQR